jgi:hypothetical protein
MPETDVEQYTTNLDENDNKTEKRKKKYIEHKHLANWCLTELISLILFVIFLFLIMPYRKLYLIIEDKNVTLPLLNLTNSHLIQ